MLVQDRQRDVTEQRRQDRTLRLLHAAARLVRGGRRTTLKIAATWPWTDEIVTAWQRVHAIPHPSDQPKPVPSSRKGNPRGRWNPRAARPDSRADVIPRP